MKPLPKTSQAKDALSTSNDGALKEVCLKAEVKVQAWWQGADDAKATVACQYVWGARPGHRDELILRDRNTGSSSSEDFDERLWSLMDYYDPTSTVNPEGEVVERYQFSAFGLRSILTPDFSPRPTSLYAWDFGFKGQFLDVDTGYYNYGYRYYSPELGRWLSRDPIGEKGGVNMYAMARNNAVNLIDLFGLWSTTAEAIWTAIGYVVPGSELPGAALAAPDAAKFIIINAFKKACERCLCTADEPSVECYGDGICTDYETVKSRLQ